jgi:hypothetical protein
MDGACDLAGREALMTGGLTVPLVNEKRLQVFIVLD